MLCNVAVFNRNSVITCQAARIGILDSDGEIAYGATIAYPVARINGKDATAGERTGRGVRKPGGVFGKAVFIIVCVRPDSDARGGGDFSGLAVTQYGAVQV